MPPKKKTRASNPKARTLRKRAQSKSSATPQDNDPPVPRNRAGTKRTAADDDPPVPRKRAGAKRTGQEDDPPAPPEPTTRQPPATPPTHSHGTRAATAARSPHVSSPPSSPKATATQAAKSPSRAQPPFVGQVGDISGYRNGHQCGI